MCSLKTLGALLLLLPTSAQATNNTLYSTFASCAGRLSAEMEHAWLMSDPHADELEYRRGQLIELLEAVVPNDHQGRALSLRIYAKQAHAKLLTQASFSTDADRAEWARDRATFELHYCASFLLES